MSRSLAVWAVLAAAAAVVPVHAQDGFDACTVFTQEDAEKALGAPARGEPQNPKVKRAKVVLGCAYNGSKEGKAVAASANFRFARTADEQLRAFEEARLQLQTKPMLISGAEAFWAGKTGQMHVRKGRAWMTLQVGPPNVRERDIDQARTLAEVLVKKL